MGKAVLATLQALLAGKEVTALNGGKYHTTRITNIISTLRNKLEIDVITEKIITENSFYGSYKLTQTPKNLKKANEVLKKLAKSNEAKKCKN